METTTHKPAGTKSYSCHVVRGRGSKAKTFDAWGTTEAQAVHGCLENAAGARVQQVSVTEWTANGDGTCYTLLGFGGRRYSLADARKLAADWTQQIWMESTLANNEVCTPIA